MGAPQLEHGLNVLAKKGRFNGERGGLKPVQELFNRGEDVAQALDGFFACGKLDAAKVDEAKLASDAFDDTKAHHHGAGVNAENAFGLAHSKGMDPPRTLAAVGA